MSSPRPSDPREIGIYWGHTEFFGREGIDLDGDIDKVRERG
jgi:hypothetical protein